MIVIANWKQNKTFPELKGWIDSFNSTVEKPVLDKVEIVVAPPSLFIIPFKMIATEVGYLKLAAQDVSKFENGAHTGEIGATQLVGLSEYSIVGHSERRKQGESIESINLKIELLLAAGIKPVVCFSTEDEYLAVKNKFASDSLKFAYEPASAISTAANSTGPASVNEVKEMVEKLGLKSVIYGGSVDELNVSDYFGSSFIEGFLVGSASLDPVRFAKIVNQFN